MNIRMLLCSDLDRTIIPNGDEPESPTARPLLRRLAAMDGIVLVYVSGRNRRLLEEAIESYDLPPPDYAVGDVGTSMYRSDEGRMSSVPEWETEISKDWPTDPLDFFDHHLADIECLELQPEDNQSRFKVSYFAPADMEADDIYSMVNARLGQASDGVELIWSVDELNSQGLLDIIPGNATKYHAVKFLMGILNVTSKTTIYAGDSGNDLPVLTSGLKSVLVRNARARVKQQALADLRPECSSNLYFAQGGFMGLNGNYSAGVLEGVAHFFPEIAQELQQ